MDPKRESRAEKIFTEAIERPESNRRDYLERSCGGDSELFARVEALIGAHEQAQGIFATEGFAKRAREVLGAAAEEPTSKPVSNVTPGQKLSHYRLVEKIGEGGMGVVWKGEDTVLERTVAIKVLPPGHAVDERKREMFLKEAKLAASLSHAHIVQVFELSHEGTLDFIVMEYVKGQPLNAMLQGRPLPADQVAELGLQIARGLAEAHSKKLVHRDLKPANILVTSEGEVKIVDFGLATLFARPSETSTMTTVTSSVFESKQTSIAGTLPYMSPEQVRGESLDARSDIFSFGSVLYEMTTGRRPFTGASAEVARWILKSQPNPVRAMVPNVPIELDHIIDKTMARRPADRYQHTDEVVVDLKRLVKGLDSGSSPSYEDLERGAPRRFRLGQLPRWMVIGGGVALASVVAVSIWILAGRTGKRAEPTLRQLTSNPPEVAIIDAAISPDGEYVAYGDGSGLRLIRIATGETQELTLPEGSMLREGLVWFPDGTALIVPVSERTAGTVRCALWRLNLLGGSLWKLSDECVYPRASPTGSLIAYRSQAAIWLMGVRGEEPRKLVAVESSSPFAWSPSGTRLAYVRRERETAVVESCNLQGGDVRRLLTDPQYRFPSAIVWLADGRFVYVRREPAPNESFVNLWAVRADVSTGRASGSPRRLTKLDGVTFFHASASADGRKLALMPLRRLSDVHVGELRDDGLLNEPLRRLTLDDREDVLSSWAPGGKAVFFSSNRGGTWDIYRQVVDSRVAEAFLVGPQDESTPVPSPDGTSLLYMVRTSKAPPEARLMEVPLSGGAPQLVMNLRARDSFFCCPRTAGGPCVVSEPLERELVFSTFDPSGGGRGREILRLERQTLGENNRWPFRGWDLSHDGSRLAVILDEAIRIIPTGDGAPFDIPRPAQSVNDLAWGAKGRNLYVAGGEAAKSNLLLRIEMQGHVDTLWSGPEVWHTKARPSPDGRYLAVAWNGWESNVWLLENP